MNESQAFHYPPELFTQLVDTIPLLCRSKKDVVLFFRGAGVPASMTLEVDEKLATDRAGTNKYEMTRTLLTALNEGGDRTLAMRRELLRRVVEFEDFGRCWPEQSNEAAGLVSHIRRVVDVKDSITRINQAQKQQAEAVRAQHEQRQAAERSVFEKRKSEIAEAKSRLFGLFSETNAHRRGKLLEAALNALFKSYGVLIDEDFRRKGMDGVGVVEQIDGVIQIDGELMLVEMKWWAEKISHVELSPHLSRLMIREGVSGLFISNSEFTPAAIQTAEQFLNQRTLVLCTLEEIVALLEREGDLVEFIRRKLRAARINRMPYKKILRA